jgi:adenylate cyclase
MFKRSSFARLFETGKAERCRLEGELSPSTSLDLVEMRDKGFTELAFFPLTFMGGSVHAISFGTKQQGGFTDEHVETLRLIVRPLSRVAETLALMRTAVNLLNAYVGNDAGERILKGHIQRGDTELIDCVIWFSDLRGFTSLSGERQPREIIAVLNEFFECQVPAIEGHGGQVLKFIGDGLLAIFPVKGDARGVGESAVKATRAAFAALEKLNHARATRSDAPLAFGVALHLGEVAYGNIGGSSRLDFTAIGPAVNLASRIESMTGKLGTPVLLSGALAQVLGSETRSVGSFELKGITGASELFEPL